MEVTHVRSPLLHPNEHGGRHRDEGFRFPENDFKGFDLAANLFQRLQRGDFAAPQVTGWKQGEMGWQMRQVRMQFLTEGGDELSDCIPHVSHKGITGVVHSQRKLYLARLTAPAKGSAIIEMNLHGVGA
ncbi:hypothetical protein SBA7_480006 [Candidatus Sulfotelmatobacter sp. SbA7]|nr:hypothetical protein SBA7_480006 [Candidatus Sulfotelmatobacter sp. SbA7]